VLDPLNPPRPQDYGYAGDLALPETQVNLPAVKVPRPEPMQTPDIVRAQYGSGDKAIVGSLLRAANGEDSGMVGITPTFAARILTSFGYPTTMDGWTGDQWAAAIDGNAGKLNPLDILESMTAGY
jgi:hypothetical protein